MKNNPEGFEFEKLNTLFKSKSKQSDVNGNNVNRPHTPKKEYVNHQTEGEEKEEFDIISYSNLIYSTIKSFFSGLIQIKGRSIHKEFTPCF